MKYKRSILWSLCLGFRWRNCWPLMTLNPTLPWWPWTSSLDTRLLSQTQVCSYLQNVHCWNQWLNQRATVDIFLQKKSCADRMLSLQSHTIRILWQDSIRQYKVKLRTVPSVRGEGTDWSWQLEALTVSALRGVVHMTTDELSAGFGTDF